MGTMACVTAAVLIDLDGNMLPLSHGYIKIVHAGIMLPLSHCCIETSVVSQCRILMTVQYMKTQLFAFSFQLTTCTCWTCQ